MNRGFVSMAILAFLGLAAALALRESLLHATRIRELGARQQRLQAREYALAAQTLAPGATLRIDSWELLHLPDGQRQARGPAGMWTIDPRLGEHWQPAR